MRIVKLKIDDVTQITLLSNYQEWRARLPWASSDKERHEIQGRCKELALQIVEKLLPQLREDLQP